MSVQPCTVYWGLAYLGAGTGEEFVKPALTDELGNELW